MEALQWDAEGPFMNWIRGGTFLRAGHSGKARGGLHRVRSRDDISLVGFS